MLDFRSDTVTQPSPAMKEAMLAAPLGDDVFGDDPSVCLLEERLADMLGHEAAIFVPSGTMSNQIAIGLHCGQGQEVLCEARSHIILNEQGAHTQFSGVVGRGIMSEDGLVPIASIEAKPGVLDDHHLDTKLICLENTHNFLGGKVLDFEKVGALIQLAESRGISSHLDGARLFNAVVASKISGTDWATLFDSVSICFSKGLGAPVGSCLLGERDFIRRARRRRKALGGGMRQAGILAAAALFALDHHIDRLEQDHQLATRIAAALDHGTRLSVNHKVETNMVFANVRNEQETAESLRVEIEKFGALCCQTGPRTLRFVTHLDNDLKEAEIFIDKIANW